MLHPFFDACTWLFSELHAFKKGFEYYKKYLGYPSTRDLEVIKI